MHSWTDGWRSPWMPGNVNQSLTTHNINVHFLVWVKSFVISLSIRPPATSSACRNPRSTEGCAFATLDYGSLACNLGCGKKSMLPWSVQTTRVWEGCRFVSFPRHPQKQVAKDATDVRPFWIAIHGAKQKESVYLCKCLPDPFLWTYVQ